MTTLIAVCALRNTCRIRRDSGSDRLSAKRRDMTARSAGIRKRRVSVATKSVCLWVRRIEPSADSRSAPPASSALNASHCVSSPGVQTPGTAAACSICPKGHMPSTPCAADAPLPRMITGFRFTTYCANSQAVSASVFAPIAPNVSYSTIYFVCNDSASPARGATAYLSRPWKA